MKDKADMAFFLRFLKPKVFDEAAFYEWWKLQSQEWRFEHRSELSDILMLCAEHYREKVSTEDLYDTIKHDEDAIIALKEAGGYSVEEWEGESEDGLDYFSGIADADMLHTIGWDSEGWFIYLLNFLPDIEGNKAEIKKAFFNLFKSFYDTKIN